MKTKMIFLLLAWTGAVLTLPAQTGRPVSAELKEVPLSAALKKLEQASGCSILFTYSDVQPYRVTASIRDMAVEQAVKKLLEGKPLTSVRRGEEYLIVLPDSVHRLPVAVRGRVTDEADRPLPYSNVLLLTPDSVDGIHEIGGTVLGSSRGRQDEVVMVETLKRMNIKILFCIGGDGTLRCAHDIVKEIERRGLNISVVCIPKTIDNDINYIDKTFGFETAVYATNSVISAAHNEAKGTPHGVGLIHVMGRDSGFIAAYATLANTHVNYCLVPEDPFSLYEGEHALLPSLERRLRERKHAVIIVSEGAGQHLFEEESSRRDKSGNVLHHNIGEFLQEKITAWGKEIKLDLSVKYFDPSYLIRSLPAHGTDAVFCEMLAQHAVHAAMAGRTDVVIGHWNDRFTHVPIPVATSSRKKIDINSSLWDSVKSVTWKCYR